MNNNAYGMDDELQWQERVIIGHLRQLRADLAKEGISQYPRAFRYHYAQSTKVSELIDIYPEYFIYWVVIRKAIETMCLG